MKQKKTPISKERYNKLIELEEFTNAVLCVAAISKSLIDELFERHKALNVNIEVMEKLAWRKIRDGAESLDHIAFQTSKDNYDRFKKSVCMVKFLILQLIARCDDSNMRIWQFYNLLKTYKLVYPAIAPTIEKEREAFACLFGQADEQEQAET